MNLRRAALALVVIVILGIAAAFGLRHYIVYELLPDRAEPNIMRLKNLQLAIQSYAQDAPTAADGRPQPLPKTLQDLVKFGYLRQSDFEKVVPGFEWVCVRGLRAHYSLGRRRTAGKRPFSHQGGSAAWKRGITAPTAAPKNGFVWGFGGSRDAFGPFLPPTTNPEEPSLRPQYYSRLSM